MANPPAHEGREQWESGVKLPVKEGRSPTLKPEAADEPEEPMPPRIVTDNATVAGSGSNKVVVYSDCANWLIL
ncbi:MAG TPA: hypothetical protein VJP88_07080 [Caulobacteraceae bacterium]|nr:hypothetical protein [Caulobacteraceae bacterium]